MLIESKNDTGNYWFFGGTLVPSAVLTLIQKRSRPYSTGLLVLYLVVATIVGLVIAALWLRVTLSPVPFALTLLVTVIGADGWLFTQLHFLPVRRGKVLARMQRGKGYELSVIHESHPLYVLVRTLVEEQARSKDLEYAGALSKFFETHAQTSVVFAIEPIQTTAAYNEFVGNLDAVIEDAMRIAVCYSEPAQRNESCTYLRDYRDMRVEQELEVIRSRIQTLRETERTARAEREELTGIVRPTSDEPTAADKPDEPGECHAAQSDAVTKENPVIVVSSTGEAVRM